MVAMKEN